MKRYKTKAQAIIKAQESYVTQSRTFKGYMDWGKMNMLPQELIAMVRNSPTAKRCIQKRAAFISGNGIKDPKLAKMIVNQQGQTLDLVHRLNGQNMGFGEVMALHIGYCWNGSNPAVCSIRNIPFQNVRLAIPDDYDNINRVGIFPYLGSSVFEKKGKLHTDCTIFNPDPEVVGLEIEQAKGIRNYNGQVLYLPMESTGDIYYHEPEWFSARTVIQTETELHNYDYKQTVNNFAISGFYEYLELPEEETTDPDNETADERAERLQARRDDERVGSVEQAIANSIGNVEAGTVVTIRHRSQEAYDSSRWTPTAGAQLSERNGTLNERVPITIARSMDVPLEIINIRRTGGIAPTGEEIEVAVNLMYQSVNVPQRSTKEQMERILSHWHKPLDNINCDTEQLDYFSKYKKSTNNGSTSTIPTAG